MLIAIPHRSRLFLVRGCFLATGTHWLPIAKPPKQRIWLLPSTLVHVDKGLTSYYAFLGLVWLHGIPRGSPSKTGAWSPRGKSAHGKLPKHLVAYHHEFSVPIRVVSMGKFPCLEGPGGNPRLVLSQEQEMTAHRLQISLPSDRHHRLLLLRQPSTMHLQNHLPTAMVGLHPSPSPKIRSTSDLLSRPAMGRPGGVVLLLRPRLLG